MENTLENDKMNHISIMLIERSRITQVEGSYAKVVAVLLLVRMIERLGWIEHTCDWELDLLITCYDGKVYDTGQTVSDLTLSHYRIELEEHEWPLVTDHELIKEIRLTLGDYDEDEFSIEISNIKTIEIVR